MNRQQLQKFVQYLIAEHYTEVLPTAQKLADAILRHRTEINTISGAPDPTAGAAKDDENSWHLDEAQVCEVVRSYLGQGSYYNSNKQLNCLFGKVREMLRAQDSNGARMLTLITEQFLGDPRLPMWKSQAHPMQDKSRQLWDQLGSLWVCIVLNPKSSQSDRNHWKELLDSWSKIEVCPQEDPDLRPPTRENHRLRSQRERDYERNRFFRENNQRNALYHQYQQQQQHQAYNNHFNNQRFYDNPPLNGNENRGYLNANNNNYDEPSSSSSDSDSESESDEEMEENIEEQRDGPLMDVPDFEVPKDEDNDRLIERINNFIEEEDNAVMNDLEAPRDEREAEGVEENDLFKFALPALRDNDDSSRESMDEDQIREEHEILENINNLDNNKEDCEKEFDDEFLPDQKEILKIDNLNYIDEHAVQEEMMEDQKENEPQAEEQKKKKTHRSNNNDDSKPNKKLKLNNGSSVAKTTKVPRTIFHKALDAVNMTWDNNHLKLILASDTYSLMSENAVQIAGSSKMMAANNTSSKSNFNAAGQALWYEPLSQCAARIDSLRSHGHIEAALRLSVSVVRTMKQVQQDGQHLWNKYRKQFPALNAPPPPAPVSTCIATPSTSSAVTAAASTKFSLSTIAASVAAATASVQQQSSSSQQQPSSSSSAECNTPKCKDCQLNKLFEFTIHKSTSYPSSSKCSMSTEGSCSSLKEPSSVCDENLLPSQPSTSQQENLPPPNHSDQHHCQQQQQQQQHQQPQQGPPKSFAQSFPPQPKPSCNAPPSGSGSSSANQMPPPPPPRKVDGCMRIVNCMCHFQPPMHHNTNHHHHHPHHNQYQMMKAGPSPSSSSSSSSNGGCQPCQYANRPPPPTHHHHNHPNIQGPPPMMPPHRMNIPPPNMYHHPVGVPSGSSSSSSSHSKYYDCKGLAPHCQQAGPMSSCQMHQKRPCIKSMCCSIVPPPEKHHHYYQRSHCNSGPSKYDYMSKYPLPGPSNPSFCNGCMRSNCLLKTHSSQMLPPIPQPPMVVPQMSAMQQPPPPAPAQLPPSSSQQNVTLCKNCKSSEILKKIPQIPPEKPPTSSASICQIPSDVAKYSIVNYGASTSKGGSSSQSAPSSLPSTSTASSSSSSTPQPAFDYKFNKKNPSCVSKCLDCSVGCEIEFPLDAVACIFDCLTEACITTTDVVRINGAEDANIIAPKYKHVLVPGSKDSTETYLTLAFDAAILALGKQRIMPAGCHSQTLLGKQQEQLIARLRNIDLDQHLVEVIRSISTQMMDGGPMSGFGESIHPESVPMHTLARFLFGSLLNQYPDLAFRIGLRAMRFPIFENANPSSLDGPSSPTSPYSRWWTLGALEGQQCSLSSTMLSASKGDKIRLSAVLENARRNIHSSTHLYKLAQDAHKFATPENGSRSHTLLEVAFELGLQVLRMTRTCLNYRRREMVRWLVTCTTQLGLEATLSIMQNWYELFTPTEATGPVATTIMQHSTIMRLNLNIKQQEELSTCARTLALQCATKDPPNCALNALTLCENDPMAFETAYHIVIDAANHIMTSSQLFTIARYMEHRGFPVRAYNLSILAMKNVHLAYNQDTHPAINDIHWGCALSHTLGKAELSKMIPIVVKNVQCATVLSDILRRCSVPNPGMSHFGNHHRGELRFEIAIVEIKSVPRMLFLSNIP